MGRQPRRPLDRLPASGLAKRPSQLDDELLQLVLWLADGGARRRTPSEPDWSAQDDRLVRGELGRLADDCQEQYVALAERARTEDQ